MSLNNRDENGKDMVFKRRDTFSLPSRSSDREVDDNGNIMFSTVLRHAKLDEFGMPVD